MAQGFGKRLEPRVKSNHAGAILCRRQDPSRTITKTESDVLFGGHKRRIEETAGLGRMVVTFKETADTSLRAASLVGWWGCQGNTNRVNQLRTHRVNGATAESGNHPRQQPASLNTASKAQVSQHTVGHFPRQPQPDHQTKLTAVVWRGLSGKGHPQLIRQR